MESGAPGMDTSAVAEERAPSECNIASLRRRAWAQSKDSILQEPEAEHCGLNGPQGNHKNGKPQTSSDEPGALKNGCSFEDDLSLGAEANHLQSSKAKTESRFGLAAERKRSQFKEGAKSMTSTGSGKSSTVSSVSNVLEQSEENPEAILLTLRVSELLDMYEEDPEEILLNLGFGREEPDPASRVPSRFIHSASSARGIDMKLYLGAQLQRMEIENPSYALTSRFRQIEVLTSVANEFFQLYSQVSGQPVQRISKDQEEEVGDEQTVALKRNNSALNVAKLLKKTISKHNLFAASPEQAEAHGSKEHKQLNGHAPSTNTNGHTHTSTEKDTCSDAHPEPPADPVNQKHFRKKDSCSLATVTEEIGISGETEDSSDQTTDGSTNNRDHQPQSEDVPPTGQGRDEANQVFKGEEEEEKNLTSTPDKAPSTLVPLQLSQLRTKTTDSFDIEEIQSNEDEVQPHRNSRTTDLSRTVSQQSDSSGFAEEPSVDSNSSLKVQESSDSCDSETTVTSHPSQDVATPIALDHPAFEPPDAAEKEELLPAGPVEADDRQSLSEEQQHDHNSEEVPQYIAHHLPLNRGTVLRQEDSQDEGTAPSEDRTKAESFIQNVSAAEQEPRCDVGHISNIPDVKEEPELPQNQSEFTADAESHTKKAEVERQEREECVLLNQPHSIDNRVSSSPVLSALKRAQQVRGGQWVEPKANSPNLVPSGGRGRGRGVPLQRSSSLPSTVLWPSKVVSSISIQFGKGQTSCTPPRYSFRFAQESGVEKESEQEKKEGQTKSSMSALNPASSSGSINKPNPPSEAPIPPKPFPRHLTRSSYSLQSSSPPPDLSQGGHSSSWGTRSVPDLPAAQQQHRRFEENTATNQNHPGWSPAFPYSNFNLHTPVQYLNPSPSPSPAPMMLNPPLQYPSPLQPYASLPNLCQYNSPAVGSSSSLSALHQPVTPTVDQHSRSLLNLHQPTSFSTPHHSSLGNLHFGAALHHQGYNHLHNNQPYHHSTPHGSQCASPYLGYHGYNAFPQSFPQCAPQAPEHSLYQGLTPHPPGFLTAPASSFSSFSSFHSTHTPPAMSSTEMQLRKVLHDIKGAVQSLGQNRTEIQTPSCDHGAALPSHQTLAEFQQKRRSLNMFRRQMMDLEMTIIQQQSLVYKHLSPAERLEVEQLQALRSAVREELQELEQQLEDKLLDLTQQTKYGGLHRESSMDSLTTASALRAMEPVSDLLREQFYLQSEISYGSRASSTRHTSRSPSPVPGEGQDREERLGTYRASVSITPAAPPRPNPEEKQPERDGGGVNTPAVGGSAGAGEQENLQQLIKQIKESMAQEIRQEIYRELLANVTAQQPLTSRQRLQ
ncbi:Sperm-specific antigen 2 [Takifugu flavidus]|uniref:Sperm-specific antigen 2 n=1 Tax=Takifugu flavidus TaxID=433684 RepID=A0A5C6PS90_9TELE|nr:Sperm-specific antigen 2 [Takifugu flavidus]